MSEIMLAEPLAGIEKSKAAQIESIFAPMVRTLKEFESQYADVMAEEPTAEACARAKALRIKISKIRIAADKERKALKEEYLRGGNAVQGVYNILKFAVVEKEEKLKERETHFERLEEERKATLQTEREEQLAKYEIDGSLMKLGEMDEMVWNNFLAGTRTNWENQKAAERQAEEERQEQARKDQIFRDRREQLLPFSEFCKGVQLSDDTTEEEFTTILETAKQKKAEYQKEQERIRKENERLQKEAEEREAQRQKEEKARIAREKKEQEAREAERRAQEKKLQAEREAREKAEAAAKAQREEQERKEREAEAARKAEEAAAAEAARKAAMAPEKEKLQNLAGELIKQVYNFDSLEAQDAINEAVRVLRAAADAL